MRCVALMNSLTNLSMCNQIPTGAHCRICGSKTLNIVNCIPELSDKLDIKHVLIGNQSLDRLFRPCDCRGEFAYAHQFCLSGWLETTKHEYCDICRFKYNVHLHDKTIFDWMSETQQVSRFLQVLCISAVVYYMSALGILNHLLSVRTPTNIVSTIVLTSSCIWAIFCTISLTIYALWSWKDFKSWKRTNRRVVVDENKNPQLDAEPRQKDILKSSGFKPG